ncbi:TonB family protein, partial [Nitrobacter sp. 62-13]
RLLAHLNRNKRFPRGAGTGTASVAFTIDRAGRVLAARLVGSTGDARLDAEAVSLLKRASPLPPPPEGFGKGRIALTVPVRFSR